MNSVPWWGFGIVPEIIMIFNFGIMILLLGGYIFLLIKAASIDRTLKEIANKLDNRQ